MRLSASQALLAACVQESSEKGLGGGFGSNLDLHEAEHAAAAAAAAAGASGGGGAGLFGPKQPGSGFSLLGGGLGAAASPAGGGGGGGGMSRAFGSSLYGSSGAIQEGNEGAELAGGGASPGRPGLLTPGFLLADDPNDPFARRAPASPPGRRPGDLIRASAESTGSDCVAWLGGD